MGNYLLSNGQSFSRGEGTEREMPLIRRILAVTEQRH